jgi:hypothetical protein
VRFGCRVHPRVPAHAPDRGGLLHQRGLEPSVAPSPPPRPAGLIDNKAERQRRVQFVGRDSTAPAASAKVAEAILGGHVICSTSYVDDANGTVRLAAVQRTSGAHSDARVYLLERLGATYRVIWSSEALYSTSAEQILDAEDIDGDGVCEVIFSDGWSGTHGAMRSLHFYFPRREQLYSVHESQELSWLPAPPAPMVGLDPEPPRELRTALEVAAMQRGFLQSVEVDLERPEAAVQRWFRDNGHARNGRITIFEYEGAPAWGGSLTAELIVDHVAWCAYFKGPLYRYDRSANRHYVVYAPADRYQWAEALVWDGESLWFGVHFEAILVRFHEPSATLQRITSIRGTAIPSIETLSFDRQERRLIVNEEIHISIGDVPTLSIY